MKYIKYDTYKSDYEEGSVFHMPYTFFIELDDLGYEKRKLGFYNNRQSEEKHDQIKFVDELGSYRGAWFSELPWKPEYYSKEGKFKIVNCDEGYHMSFVVEIKKDDFDQVWEAVVEQYLLKECGVERDKEIEVLIDFNKLPEVFSVDQLEYLSNEYIRDPNSVTFYWLKENHMEQIKDYIERTKK